MYKFLSIIIPRYKETEKDIFPLLSSINGQIGIDFSKIEVIIANDGGGAGPLDDSFIELFNMDIRQVNLEENRGPGVARQRGLDAAVGDYVMFCDADDSLHSVGVLGALIQETENSAPDLLTSSWIEEIALPDGGYYYITHQVENTWMHGKIIRRRFLTQNNIRFHEELRVHEDSYILAIAAAFADKYRFMNITSYVWKYQADSITRRNNGIYTFESFPTFIEACSMAHRELENRSAADMEYKILQFVLYIYFSLQKAEWQAPEVEKYKTESEKVFAKHMVTFWKWWTNAKPERLMQIYNQERERTFAGRIEMETIDNWIARIKKLAEDDD